MKKQYSREEKIEYYQYTILQLRLRLMRAKRRYEELKNEDVKERKTRSR